MEARYEIIYKTIAEKQLKKLPRFIREAVRIWVHAVEEGGIREVRKIPGYHDEPLFGMRRGQRSVRLNRSYRLIYKEYEDGRITIVQVMEVNKHAY